jgi:hypothetical protein
MRRGLEPLLGRSLKHGRYRGCRRTKSDRNYLILRIQMPPCYHACTDPPHAVPSGRETRGQKLIARCLGGLQHCLKKADNEYGRARARARFASFFFSLHRFRYHDKWPRPFDTGRMGDSRDENEVLRCTFSNTLHTLRHEARILKSPCGEGGDIELHFHCTPLAPRTFMPKRPSGGPWAIPAREILKKIRCELRTRAESNQT